MSTGEILLIFIVYLLFFGAKGIPSLAQTLGKAIYQFRNATKDVQDEILKGASEIRNDFQSGITHNSQPGNQEVTVTETPQKSDEQVGGSPRNSAS
ncbi:MAG: twin-arginine translocase TatA/TatE family subunit [Flavobacteriales bacterium]